MYKRIRSFRLQHRVYLASKLSNENSALYMNDKSGYLTSNTRLRQTQEGSGWSRA